MAPAAHREKASNAGDLVLPLVSYRRKRHRPRITVLASGRAGLELGLLAIQPRVLLSLHHAVFFGFTYFVLLTSALSLFFLVAPRVNKKAS